MGWAAFKDGWQQAAQVSFWIHKMQAVSSDKTIDDFLPKSLRSDLFDDDEEDE